MQCQLERETAVLLEIVEGRYSYRLTTFIIRLCRIGIEFHINGDHAIVKLYNPETTDANKTNGSEYIKLVELIMARCAK